MCRSTCLPQIWTLPNVLLPVFNFVHNCNGVGKLGLCLDGIVQVEPIIHKRLPELGLYRGGRICREPHERAVLKGMPPIVGEHLIAGLEHLVADFNKQGSVKTAACEVRSEWFEETLLPTLTEAAGLVFLVLGSYGNSVAMPAKTSASTFVECSEPLPMTRATPTSTETLSLVARVVAPTTSSRTPPRRWRATKFSRWSKCGLSSCPRYALQESRERRTRCCSISRTPWQGRSSNESRNGCVLW